MKTIKELQEFLGVEADGVWGKKSQAVLDAVLHPVVTSPEDVHPQVDSPSEKNVWPKEADAPFFYGRSDGSSSWESQNLVTFEAPYAFYMDGQLVRRIRCHRLVKDSLLRILQKIQQLYPTPESRSAAGIDQYDGCYNFRSVRGASHLSMHAYGAAIDIDAAHNPLGATHGKMPENVVAAFKAEGWRWGGDYSGRKDWMHFEACR